MQSFTATVNGKDEGPFETFGEAAKNFFGRVIEKIDASAMTRMTLETACWIQGDFDEKRIPMLFDDAKELAYELEIMLDGGAIADPLPTVDSAVVEAAFAKTKQSMISGLQSGAISSLNEAARLLDEMATA
jgi:hypothetical protein